jgi:hypothetical protein
MVVSEYNFQQLSSIVILLMLLSNTFKEYLEIYL